MANKLTPPPPTGNGLLDRWLALLWRLLTAPGQLLREQISDFAHNHTADADGGALTNDLHDGYIEVATSAAPGTPASGKVRIYAQDAAGVGRLRVVHSSGSDLAMFRDAVVRVKNTSGVTINKGEIAYVTGATGNFPTIAKARANAAATMPAAGMVLTTAADNTFTTLQFAGEMTGLDTSAFAEGARVFASATTAGAITATEPQHPNLSQAIGVITKANAGAGSIQLFITLQHEGDDYGSNRNTFSIGDGGAGAKVLAFVNAFIGSLSWTPTANRTLTLPDETGTVALTSNKLSAFAATTSAELAGVISDETGSGALVFGTSPTISTATISSSSSSDALRINSTSTGKGAVISTPGVISSQVQICSANPYDNTGFYLTTAGATNGFLSGGANFNGSSWVARSTSAWAFGGDTGGATFYFNTGLTVGNTFSFLSRLRVIDTEVTPGTTDNTISLGSASFRWKEIFAGNATINTSDAREKTPVRALTPTELIVAKQLSSEIGIYQWLAAIEEKGDGARLHVGMTVQRALEIFVANGLDPFRYGLVCYDEWEEKTTSEEVEAGDPDAVINGTKQVQATETQTRHWQAIEIIDGVATLVAKSETFDAPVFDLLPVFDEAGEPVMKGGEQLTHQVPVMIDAPRYVKITHTPAGNRYGFRGNELLLLIAAGFNARLTDLEQSP